MKQETPSYFILRLLIPILIIPLLGISPLPHDVYSAFGNIRNALMVEALLNASSHLPKILAYFPGRVDLWELTGHYAFLGGDTESAATYFQHAATIDSLSAAGYIEFGDAAQQNGDFSTAVEAWQTAIAMDGPSIELYTRLYETHDLQDDLDAVINDLYFLTELEPTNPNHFYKLGIILSSIQPETALAYLIQASELETDYKDDVQTIKNSVDAARKYDDPAYTLLESGRALANLNQWEHAIRAFEEAIKFHPNFADAWAFSGEAKQHIEVDDEQHQNSNAGLVELEKALEIDPQSIAANTFMALFWQRQQHYDLALVYLHAADSIEPNNPNIQIEIGRTLAIMGNLEKAQDYYNRATEISPNDPHFWRQLAGFSIKYDTQLREIGLPAARKAILLNPEDPASLDTMGEIFILLQDIYSGIRFLERAIEAQPDYAPAHLHLGFAYLLIGNDDLAQKYLTFASTFATQDSTTAQQARRILDSSFP